MEKAQRCHPSRTPEKKRSSGKSNTIKRVDLDHQAFLILKQLTKHHWVTQSKTIELYLEKAWLEISDEGD